MGKIQNRIFGLHLSIRQLMLFFILTLMLLFSIISIFTYTFFSRRALKNSVVNDTVHIVQQTKKLLDERLYKLFEQFVVFSNQSSLNNVLIKSSSQSPQKLGPRDYIEIDRDLSNLYMFNTSIVNSLIVYLNDGNASFIKGDFIFDNVNFDFAQWYGEYESGEYHWQNIHRSDLIQPVGEGQNTATLFRLIGTPDSQVNGIILLNLKEEYFKELLAQDPAFSPNYFALLSPDGITYFNSPEEKYLLDEQLTTRILTNEKTSDNLSYRLNNGEKISVIYDTILINGWKLISIIPEEKMFADVNKMTNMMIFYSAIFIIIALAISAAFSNLLIKPILQLANKVKMIGRGEKNVKFDIQANNEIGTLNDGIQEMMNRINQLIERVYLEMDNKRVAELSALQAQIQPHFLYNTLFAIKQLCELGETENANAMVSGLANFYRIGVSGGREIIPIKEEISHVESYLRIQQMRYEEDRCV